MKMTWKKLSEMVIQGYGSGHGNNYKSFLTITRRNTSPSSNQSVGSWLFGQTRRFNYFSRSERLVALVLWWLGAVDVREQFPIWPIPHEHPLIGADGLLECNFPLAPGLLDIASGAGIDHGIFPGTQIPYIATLDLVATVRRNGNPKLVAISCKPYHLISKADSTSRMLERMELERLYCCAVDIPRCVAEAEIFTKPLIANLEWMMPNPLNVAGLRNDQRLYEFLETLKCHIHYKPIDQTIMRACKKVGWDWNRGNTAFRYLSWHQELDIDMSLPISMTQPASSGGSKLKRALQVNVLGEIDHEQL